MRDAIDYGYSEYFYETPDGIVYATHPLGSPEVLAAALLLKE